ncbi:NAD(P)/FAD-dependent oxidoreductase [Microbacterium sp.]|uniref:flavin-containing monooxygenase n=1 Tax=Microbacterium sp. TaxID=51671 RepID=UPI00289FFFF0|nr:NAD(P)/FAD-dependent oxidoreductase [Microbacterium sp.]
MDRYAVIGAGPSGLAAARALTRRGIAVDGYEASHGVGGLWDITNPRSTMYESAHLISSRTTTEFAEFPMRSSVDYPGHRVLLDYFREYAGHFGLTELFRFDTRVTRLEPRDGGWELTSTGPEGRRTHRYAGIVLANGTLAEPRMPSFDGEFSGEMLHTSAYTSPAQLDGRRVLIIGAGNSGCDIAVDAVHHAASIDMSVRRGYHFVPRYLFGRPSDTLNQGRPLPARLKQAVDSRVLRAFTGDPARFGFPKPDHRIYESHPIVNTLILHHLGQGDLRIRPDVERFDGQTVRFRDATADEYDLVLMATGYTLDYPFVDREHLHWQGAAPRLFLNIFPASFNGLFVLGMIEASGIGWQGRYEQAELLATYLEATATDPARAARFRSRVTGAPWPDLTGGYRYLALDRMAHYVNNHAYRRALRHEQHDLAAPAHTDTPRDMIG